MGLLAPVCPRSLSVLGGLALKDGEQRVRWHCVSREGVNEPCFITYSGMRVTGECTLSPHFSGTFSSFAAQIVNSLLKALAKTLDS